MPELLLSPDGVLSSVPDNQIDDALDPNKGGFTKPPPVAPALAVSPAGVLTKLDPSTMKDALDPNKGGFTLYQDVLKKHEETIKAVNDVRNNELKLPGDEFRVSNYIWGGTAANNNLQDDKGNYHLIDENGDPILIYSTDVVNYLHEHPDAKFENPDIDKAFRAHLASQDKGAFSKNVDLPERVSLFNEFNNNDIGFTNYNYDNINYPNHTPSSKLESIANSLYNLRENKTTSEKVAGTVGRELSSLVVMGPVAGAVGGAVEAALPVATTLGGRLGVSALRGAAEGFTFASPKIAAQAILDKDPAGAAETLAYNMLGGALLNVGLHSVIEGGAAALNAIRGPRLAQEADHALLEALGMNKNEIESLGKSPEDRAQKLQSLWDYLGEEKIKGLTITDLKKEVSGLREEVGPKIGNLIKSLDEVASKNSLETPSASNMLSRIEELKNNLLSGPLQKATANTIEDALQTIEKNSTREGNLANVSFEDAQKLKKAFQGEANWRTDASDNLNNVRKQIAGIVRDEFDIAAQNVATNSGNVKLVKDFTDYKNIYGLAKDLETPLGRATGNSRIANFIGGIVGRTAGMAIGHASGVPFIGPMIGYNGGKKAANLLDLWLNERSATKIATLLKKLSRNEFLGSYVAMDAASILKSQLAEITKRLGQVAIKSSTPDNQIKHILGDSANGLSANQQFHKISDVLIQSQSNPDIFRQHISSISEPISYHHPEIGKMFEDNVNTKIKYLYDNMPKSTKGPSAFGKEEKFEPSKEQLKEFNKLLKIANDPFSVIDDLKSGKLTSKQVHALAVMNPAIFNNIRDELYKAAYSGKTNLTYQQKLSAALLMGQDLDTGINKIPAFQQAYATAAQSTAPVPKKPSRGGSKGLDISKMPTAQYTPIQRLNK